MVSTPVNSKFPRRRVEIVDYYRLFAALSVVAFHYLYNGINNGKVDSIEHEPIAEIARWGYLGVDLFFVISGYVIIASVDGKDARRFAVGRALRLYPAFWVALIITTLFALVLGGERMGVSREQFLWNLTMVPKLVDQPLVDGVYWTLLYEVQFYVLVLVLVLVRQGHRLMALAPGWAIGMFILDVVDPSLSTLFPYLGGYFLWFAGGAVIAAIAREGWSIYRLVGLLAAYLPATDFEVSVKAVLATAIYVLMLATLVPAVRDLKLPGSTTAGSLTYPLYLVHAHIGYMLLDAYATEENKWFAYATVIILVVSLAYTLHMSVEHNPTARRFWAWSFEATLGRAVGMTQAVVDAVLPVRNSASPAHGVHVHSRDGVVGTPGAIAGPQAADGAAAVAADQR